ncbi:MAG: efflux RND transporter periplasmic adaptor subunit [Pseudomonadota bacterium]
MRRTYITASAIALLLIVWLLSGRAGDDGADASPPTLAEINRAREARVEDAEPPRVRVRVAHAQPRTEHVVLRGRTENKRTVEVKAEIAGRLVERPVDRGSQVDAGDLLCRLSTDDREAGLKEAQAAAEQARIEYEGSLRLEKEGLQSKTAIAQARARLAAAQAQVERRELDLQRTTIRAPFAGVVENVHLDTGDYATAGTPCVTLVDMNPMLLTGRVSENRVTRLEPGQTATGVLADGREVRGPITFVGQQAEAATRTYAVEVEVDNADRRLRSGITTEIRIPVNEVMAQRVSPALFALNDDGEIGIRIVNDDNEVEYHEVEIVDEDAHGAWVTGLPEVMTLITVGQELVVPGQEVEPVFEPSAEMPARAPAEERRDSSASLRAPGSESPGIAAAP